MGLFENFGNRNAGRSSAEGGNGNVRNTRGGDEHEAVSTPNLAAVRNLAHGDPGYDGKHRAQ
jgi:hypothetical protein